MATERHGLAQRRHKGFAVWAGTQVPTNFLANICRELIVDIGGQLAQDTQAARLLVGLFLLSRCRRAWRLGAATSCHKKTVPLLSYPMVMMPVRFSEPSRTEVPAHKQPCPMEA